MHRRDGIANDRPQALYEACSGIDKKAREGGADVARYDDKTCADAVASWTDGNYGSDAVAYAQQTASLLDSADQYSGRPPPLLAGPALRTEVRPPSSFLALCRTPVRATDVGVLIDCTEAARMPRHIYLARVVGATAG
ncbi:hypothetical protein NM688_g7335 [Phlebia brevispora]|uniref:Uncharacterized protein n=1 Tax=Phlebia brevispora TaxID=194682 RepID=A0ACC1S6G8_9APHY|nr:hypothetical protein NM688_g7335 [Phlebia brevispora]